MASAWLATRLAPARAQERLLPSPCASTAWGRALCFLVSLQQIDAPFANLGRDSNGRGATRGAREAGAFPWEGARAWMGGRWEMSGGGDRRPLEDWRMGRRRRCGEQPAAGLMGWLGSPGERAMSSGQLAESTSNERQGLASGNWQLSDFPPNRVRNFSIIAHIDHGKSTLADRLLEVTGAIRAGAKQQYLDKLQVERERGITVKAQTASLVYHHAGIDYLLNLVDTPGHVDFCYEVSRSLAACQGAILIVDASQGVQAQTVANFYLAFEQDLEIVPVVNKIDMPAAEPERVAEEMHEAFDLDPTSVLRVSAKTGVGVEAVLDAVVEVSSHHLRLGYFSTLESFELEGCIRHAVPVAICCAVSMAVRRVPPPGGSMDRDTRVLLFDAFHDEYRGVICLVEIVDGSLRKGEKITSISTGDTYEVLEIGVLAPEPLPMGVLFTGQVGYIITGMKSTRSARIGDTWHHVKKPVAPLPGFKPAKSNVFAGLYPTGADGFDMLSAAMERLTLNDASVTVRRENSNALGSGFRCGFLGMLHMDVFRQRLEQEYGANVLVTSPTVPFVIVHPDGTSLRLENPCDFPLTGRPACVLEPTVVATIVTPSEFVGRVMELCQDRRGDMREHSHIGRDRVVLKYLLPLAELAVDFFNDLKSSSQGYASIDYEESDDREAQLQRMDLIINGEPIDALARIVHRSRVQQVGRALCDKLKGLLDRQLFEIVVQASAANKIVARASIPALRKNVLAKCYGGDVSRKRKLLEKQKEGKKRMRRLGSVDVPQEAFQEMMKLR